MYFIITTTTTTTIVIIIIVDEIQMVKYTVYAAFHVKSTLWMANRNMWQWQSTKGLCLVYRNLEIFTQKYTASNQWRKWHADCFTEKFRRPKTKMILEQMLQQPIYSRSHSSFSCRHKILKRNIWKAWQIEKNVRQMY